MRLTPTAATRRFALATAGAGILGAVALPGTAAGLGVLLVAVAIAAAALTLGAFPLRGPNAFLLVLALLLAGGAVLRDADWLVAIDLTGAACMASLAASRRRSGWSVLRGAFALAARLPAAPAFVAWSAGVRLSRGTLRTALPAARGLILTASLAVVFGGLFASADAAFAHLAGEVLAPDLELGRPAARLAAFVGVAAIAGGLVTVALAGPATAGSGHGVGPARREWITALAVLNALVAAFVAVQLTVLFGGHEHVLETTGLTYAQYAREGFIQLSIAAALTLAVLAAAWPHLRRAPGRADALELLLGLLCVLTLVVLVSALRRLALYEDAFGFTVTRLSAHATLLWIGGVLIFVLAATVLPRSGWLALAIAGLTGVTLLAFTLVNPEGLVAKRNVERFRHSGRIDISYLRQLSADATPALMALPRRRSACAIAVQAEGLRKGDGFFGLNAARARARRAVAGRAERPLQAPC